MSEHEQDSQERDERDEEILNMKRALAGAQIERGRLLIENGNLILRLLELNGFTDSEKT